MANLNAANPNGANTTPVSPPLPGLADIQEPLLANDWYFAPIWSLLLLLIVVLTIVAGYRWWRYYQAQKPVKYALAELDAIDLTAPNAAEMITTLMKRLILTQAPAHPAITMNGKPWQQFLTSSMPPNALPAEPLPDLLALHYQSAPAEADIRRYASFAATWLKRVKLTNSGAANA
ncbi:MAG: DUF4381 domain-containing protein [Gammaproteobacteria bacterium]|nr:DUF4381 domain-containing protein [Gammaproteobacteria bacterium]